MAELTIEHDGDTWRILATGAVSAEGKVYCHLASTTRSRKQRNGTVPVQIGDWIDHALIERDAITAYYEDRNASGMSPLNAHR